MGFHVICIYGIRDYTESAQVRPPCIWMFLPYVASCCGPIFQGCLFARTLVLPVSPVSPQSRFDAVPPFSPPFDKLGGANSFPRACVSRRRLVPWGGKRLRWGDMEKRLGRSVCPSRAVFGSSFSSVVFSAVAYRCSFSVPILIASAMFRLSLSGSPRPGIPLSSIHRSLASIDTRASGSE